MKKPKLTPRERLGRKIIRLTAIRDEMFRRWKIMDIEDYEEDKK